MYKRLQAAKSYQLIIYTKMCSCAQCTIAHMIISAIHIDAQIFVKIASL